MSYDNEVEFTAHVAVGLRGPVAIMSIDEEAVLDDFCDAPMDWVPAKSDLESGIYALTGNYCYDVAGLDGNPHHATSEYKNVKWEKVS